MILEEYYKYKVKYKEFIVMIKFGNFYELFDRDAVIINNIAEYKLSKIADTVKCGFPISGIDKILNLLEYRHINYLVIENENIINEKDFDDNIYNSFNFDMDNIKYNFMRINKITKELNEIAYSEISNLLDDIEGLINERR